MPEDFHRRARRARGGRGEPVCRRGLAGSRATGRFREAVLRPAILLSLLRDESHGYSLIDDIYRLVGGEVCVDPGSLYRLLRRLEDEELVTSSWVLPDRGPSRRSYVITALGREALARYVEELRRRAQALESVAEEAERQLAAASTGYAQPVKEV